jgi:hypothetical protein
MTGGADAEERPAQWRRHVTPTVPLEYMAHRAGERMAGEAIASKQAIRSPRKVGCRPVAPLGPANRKRRRVCFGT